MVTQVRSAARRHRTTWPRGSNVVALWSTASKPSVGVRPVSRINASTGKHHHIYTHTHTYIYTYIHISSLGKNLAHSIIGWVIAGRSAVPKCRKRSCNTSQRRTRRYTLPWAPTETIPREQGCATEWEWKESRTTSSCRSGLLYCLVQLSFHHLNLSFLFRFYSPWQHVGY